MLRVPIACPECARVVLTDFPLAWVAKALSVGRSIRLYAACHDKVWTATELEREQFRRYLLAAGGPR